MSDVVRVAVVGAAGWIGGVHWKSHGQNPRAKVVAVCDDNVQALEALLKKMRDVDRVPAELLPTQYADYRDMLNHHDGLDAVDVCTPNFMHASHVIAALQAGNHVMTEKPMARTPQEARTMYDEAQRHPELKAMVAFNWLQLLQQRIAVEAIGDGKNGELGRLWRVQAWWKRRFGFPFKGFWFTEEELSGGGPGIDLSPHLWGFVLKALGRPALQAMDAFTYYDLGPGQNHRGIYAGGRHNPNGVCDVESSMVFRASYPGNLAVDVEVSFAEHGPWEAQGVRIIGSKATLEFEHILPDNNDDDTTAVDSWMLYTTEVRGGQEVTVNKRLNAHKDPRCTSPLVGRMETPPVFIDWVLGIRPDSPSDFGFGLEVQETIGSGYDAAPFLLLSQND